MNSRKQALIFSSEKSKYSSNIEDNSSSSNDSSYESKISLSQAIEDFKLMTKIEEGQKKPLIYLTTSSIEF